MENNKQKWSNSAFITIIWMEKISVTSTKHQVDYDGFQGRVSPSDKIKFSPTFQVNENDFDLESNNNCVEITTLILS